MLTLTFLLHQSVLSGLLQWTAVQTLTNPKESRGRCQSSSIQGEIALHHTGKTCTWMWTNTSRRHDSCTITSASSSHIPCLQDCLQFSGTSSWYPLLSQLSLCLLMEKRIFVHDTTLTTSSFLWNFDLPHNVKDIRRILFLILLKGLTKLLRICPKITNPCFSILFPANHAMFPLELHTQQLQTLRKPSPSVMACRSHAWFLNHVVSSIISLSLTPHITWTTTSTTKRPEVFRKHRVPSPSSASAKEPSWQDRPLPCRPFKLAEIWESSDRRYGLTSYHKKATISQWACKEADNFQVLERSDG